MDLLKNELIVKYFGQFLANDYNDYCTTLALQVLCAMQEPIRKGDKLIIIGYKEIFEHVCPIDFSEEFHPTYLRLPDVHQKKEERDPDNHEGHLDACPRSKKCTCVHQPPAEECKHERYNIVSWVCKKCGELVSECKPPRRRRSRTTKNGIHRHKR